jgi:hypothetical protein
MGFWVTCGVKMTDSHLKILLVSVLDIYKVFEHIDLLSIGPTWLRLLWGSGCGVKMMSLHHCWGLQPPQTASYMHIRLITIVWAHWYTVHWYTVAALHSYTHLSWLRFWGSGSLVESKWCHYVMVEAYSHLKWLPASILDYKLFEHIDMLSNNTY